MTEGATRCKCSVYIVLDRQDGDYVMNNGDQIIGIRYCNVGENALGSGTEEGGSTVVESYCKFESDWGQSKLLVLCLTTKFCIIILFS